MPGFFEKNFSLLGRPFDWLFGNEFQHDTTTKPHDYSAVVAVLAILVAVAAGLIAYVQGETEKKLGVVTFYVVLSILPLSQLLLLLRSHDGNKKYALDKGTVMFARGSLIVGTIFVLGLAYACYAQLIPGQGTVPLRVVQAKPHNWEHDYPDLSIQKGNKGVDVDVAIDPTSFPKRKYPDPLAVSVTLGKEFQNRWRVADAFGYEGVEAEVTNRAKPPAFLIDDDPNKTGDHTQTILWNGLQNGRRYVLRLRLASNSKEDEQESVIRLSKDGNSFIDAEAIPSEK